ncbi:MAG TPA: hypothetical protein VFR68_15730 [Candidatus Dormibacteraeota bacterium]|nr:hypothetical protein [Candidatus Dormibacteraeota bacterium]
MGQAAGLSASTRLWPVLGIVAWILVFLGLAVHGYPKVNASAQQLATWTSTTDRTRFVIGVELEAIGFLVLLLFVAWLCHVLRRLGGAGWLLVLALVSTAAWVAVGITGNGVWTALLDAGKQGVSLPSLTSIRDIAQAVFDASNLLLPLALISLGLASIGREAIPRWLGWASLVIGILMLIGPLAAPLQIAFIAWVLAVSVLFLVRPIRTGEDRERAP